MRSIWKNRRVLINRSCFGESLQTFEITPRFFHVGHVSLDNDFQVLIGLAFQRHAIPNIADDYSELELILDVVGPQRLVVCDNRRRRSQTRCDRRRRLFGWING